MTAKTGNDLMNEALRARGRIEDDQVEDETPDPNAHFGGADAGAGRSGLPASPSMNSLLRVASGREDSDLTRGSRT